MALVTIKAGVAMGFDIMRDSVSKERLVEVSLPDEIRDLGQWRNLTPASLFVHSARGSCNGLGKLN